MNPPAAPTAAPRRRRLRWIGVTVLTLLLLTVAGSAWLLGTSSGLRFALARAQSLTHGALQVQSAAGRLLGPLDLSGVRYRDGSGLEAQVAKAHLELRAWPLLRKQLQVIDLDVEGVDVTLAPSSPSTEKGDSSFSLKPPLDLLLDRVHVGTVNITQGGQPLFASNTLDLAGSWTANGIELRQLDLRSPDGHAALGGKLAVGKNYRGDGSASFAWKVGGNDYAGSLAAHSDGDRAHVDVKLAQPMVAQLQLDLRQSGDFVWTAKLDAPGFDPKPLIGPSSLTALAVSLQGHGDRYSGNLDGTLDLNDYKLLLQPLSVQFSHDFKTLTLRQLNVGSPQIKGSVAASGTVQLDAQPISADLTVQWNDLQLPTELVGQPLVSHGTLKAKGSANRYHAEGDVAIGPPGKLAALALNLDGTPQQIALHTLALKQARGGMQVSGTLTLQPALAWQVDATADQLDPGQLLAGWNGALNFDIASHGTLPQNRPDVTLEIRKLGGTLRQRAIKGDGSLHLSPDQIVDGQLNLASGGSTVRIDAKRSDNGATAANDIALNLAVTSLGDWLPNAGGRLNGGFHVRGRQPKLSIDGQLQGQSIAYQQQRVAGLQLDANVPDISHPGGKFNLQLHGVNAGGLLFSQIGLLASGTAAQHRLNLDARGTQLSATLALSGSLKGSDWRGTLSELTVLPQGLPGLRLQQPSQLAYVAGAMSMSDTCLSAGDPLLCVQATQDKAGNLDASYRLRQLPLALLMNAAGEANLPMRADGMLEGNGSIRRNAAGAFSGNASITSAHGSVTYTDHAEAPLITYDRLTLAATLSPDSQHVELHSGLDSGGRLDGQITVSGAQQALAGQLDLHLNKLGFVELLTSDVANVKGALVGSFRIGGTLKQPSLLGNASLSNFAAEVPVAGLKLTQGKLVVSALDSQHFRLDGTVQSGKGSLAIGGSVGLGATAQTLVTLKGSRFTAADIPAAKVVISPDMTIKQDSKGIAIGGGVTLDSADINLEKLPGAGATKASPDIVLVDQKPQDREQAATALPISAQVKVDLGDKTHLVGKGLDGKLSGQLTVSDTPGRATTGRGQIAVDGTYKAYGQNLQIENGQLLFATTPIDNPGLNIRAVRKINPNNTIDDGQVVGLLIAGTAQRPNITVFSNPVMQQSDALSYLITGKPLSDVKGGEGSAVSSAAQALGSAGGNMLAKSIGTRLGVDDIGVTSSDALNGNSAFTVGKYLSPRLYLSYGVGLFDPGQVITLRYRLTQRWNFEAQNATDFNRASLNYRYER
ncbi:translocation and assembly module TamB [Rhodanobacter sp. ANJX3]|nr:translocation and assembly module TamB [Rhodanobacter sp. ANJX3]NYE28331.1 translocation and assembly module TamB [Rhodanobacter sp. K2T2]